MHAHQMRAAHNRDGNRGGRPEDALLLRASGDSTNKALARCADHQRQIESLEPTEAIENGEILLQRFAKADAWVKDDLLAPDAARFSSRKGNVEIRFNLAEDVAARLDLLHGRRVSADMHQHERGAGARRLI